MNRDVGEAEELDDSHETLHASNIQLRVSPPLQLDFCFAKCWMHPSNRPISSFLREDIIIEDAARNGIIGKLAITAFLVVCRRCWWMP